LKRIGLRLSVARKISLAAAWAAVLVIPTAVGILNAPAIRAQSLQARAQSAAAATTKFEVASIKPGCGNMGGDGTIPKGRDDARDRRSGQSPGRLIECGTVMNFIQMAYVEFANGRLHPPEPMPISGGPAWINSDRYQINAKAGGTPSQIEMRGAMLRALLEDRFSLKIHHETREVPIYTLTVAKGGKLQPSKEGSCIPPDLTTPLEPGQKPCGVPLTTRNGPNLITEMVASLDDLSKVLGVTVGRPVIDKTGITGIFNLHLEFAIDEATSGVQPALSDESSGPSIFTALQQQLGLKLSSAKGPGEFLIIDHVEKPSPN
jgi:uncharacterized protein (TIGR03435 family)